MLYITDREVVAPIKATTIPKLELTSAISTKVATLLQAELNIERAKDFFWTDCEVVLGYLKNQQKCFHLFVTNRVQMILENSHQD